MDKFKMNKEGHCPFCGDDELEYDSMNIEEEMVYYPWTCTNCGHEGEEWYELGFAGHNVEDEVGDIIEITPDMVESEHETTSPDDKLTSSAKAESKVNTKKIQDAYDYLLGLEN